MQRIKVCNKCGAQMDKSAKACPQCGAPVKSKGGWIIGGIVLIVIIAVAAGGSGSSGKKEPSVVSQVGSSAEVNTSNASEETVSEAISESSQEEISNIFHVGDVIDTGKANVTFKSVEDYVSDNMFTQPEEGNKFIQAYFIIENKDTNDLFTGSWDFKCYADNSVCDARYVTEKALPDSTISPGRKSEGYICFEVPENAEKIEIEYEMSWWTQEKAIFIIKE